MSSAARDLAICRAAIRACGGYEWRMSNDAVRAIIAEVDASLGGDDRASDGEQNAEAGNLAQASPVVHPTPPAEGTPEWIAAGYFLDDAVRIALAQGRREERTRAAGIIRDLARGYIDAVPCWCNDSKDNFEHWSSCKAARAYLAEAEAAYKEHG